MAQFLEQLINGLVLGGIYALIAVGYTMVYGIIQLINFAHGEIFMLGAYFSFVLVAVLHVPFWVALPICMLLCAGIGMAMDVIAYRPLRKAPRLSALITAIGMSLALQNLARIIWGARQRTFPEDAIPALFLSENAIPLPGGADLPYRDLFIILFAAVLMILLNRLIYLTKIGKAMRCLRAKPSRGQSNGHSDEPRYRSGVRNRFSVRCRRRGDGRVARSDLNRRWVTTKVSPRSPPPSLAASAISPAR